MLVRSESGDRDGQFGPERQWVLKRNCAMAPRQLLAFYLSLVVVSLLIAGGLAAIGAWMVLPFSGIDLLAVGAALLIYGRRSRDYERVSLAGVELIVEVFANGRSHITPLNRFWVQLESVERGGRAARALVLRQHGLRVSVGALLGDEERRQFGRELRSALAHTDAVRRWT